MEWFYEGKDGEVVDKWISRQEKQADGTDKRVFEKEIESMSTEDQVNGKHLRVPAAERGKEGQMQGVKKIKLNVNSMVARTGLDGATGPARGVGAQRAVVIKGAKRACASRGTKGKGPATPQPMAVTRARRSRTKGVRYVDEGDDDSDGEFVP